jgi:hypothetical protein
MVSRSHRVQGINERHTVLTLILLADTPPPPVDPEPTLRAGLTADMVGPGFLGFLLTFGIVVAMFFLIRDMVKRIRRVRYREQVAEGGSHGPAAANQDDDDDSAVVDARNDDAGIASGGGGADTSSGAGIGSST